MRYICSAFALILLTHSTATQDKKAPVPQSSTSVLFNGQPVKGKVLDIDGKHFVAVEDLAQSLRGTISYSDGQISLTFSQLPTVTQRSFSSQLPTVIAQSSSSLLPSMTPQAHETGSIRGTLTYFFDFHTGNKPDAGSKVWLLEGHVELPANQKFLASSTKVGTGGNPEQYAAIKYSVADENGNYELLDVTPGQYTLIMQSAHTVGTLNEKGNFFGRGNGRTPRDISGRVESRNLLVKSGETANGSKDFGPKLNM